MKAIVYTEYGPPDVLRLVELNKPELKDDEVLIRVHAVEATKSDCEMRSLNFPVRWFLWPLRLVLGWRKPKRQILGGYFSGDVNDIGKNVTQYKLGEKVFGAAQLRMGTYAEYASLPESYAIAPKPANMNYVEAATVPLGGLNAIHFIKKAEIQPGETVLINGAGGSIGIFGLQMAKSLGARVTAVDSDIKKNMLLALGAEKFINYKEEDFTKLGEPYDVIFDMVASSSHKDCLNALNPGGRYITANPTLSKMLRSLFVNRLTNKKSIFALAHETEEELHELREMIEVGKLKAVVDRIYTLEQAAEAHHRVETEQRCGAIAIAITPDASSTV